MISTISGETWREDSDRLLVVGPRGRARELVQAMRTLYPDRTMHECESYLSAIADLGRRPAEAVLASVDAALSQMPAAVAGLRRAVGEKAKLVLCCPTQHEPLTRRLMVHGADDYVLTPLARGELDAAFGWAPPVSAVNGAAAKPQMEVTTTDLDHLVRAVAAINGRPRELLDVAAEMLRASFHARSATVVAEGAVAVSGDGVEKPVLSAPLTTDGRSLGSISLGLRVEGSYDPAQVRRFEQYAAIIARLLDASADRRRWRRLAMTDDCTGLPNRRYLHERMREILGRAAAECLPVTLLLFDLDHFKAYNDSYGHDAGDEVLRFIGELFRKHCREQDVVTRYGGDEFAVVFWDPEGPRMPGSKHPDCALAVLERIREALRSTKPTKIPAQGDVCLTISGGLATYPWAGQTLATLLAHADEALLAAKRAGRNQVLRFGDAHRPAVADSEVT